MPRQNDFDDDGLIEVGFHLGLCPEYEEPKLIECMEYINQNVKYILVLETEEGMEYPYNRLISKNKYLLEAFDHDENCVQLQIKKGQVKNFVKYIEKQVEDFSYLFRFSKEIAKEDFKDVITTGLLVSRVALEGEIPGLASKMAFVCITTP